MTDGLSDDTKKKFMLSLTIELHDPKEKLFHNAPVFSTAGPSFRQEKSTEEGS